MRPTRATPDNSTAWRWLPAATAGVVWLALLVMTVSPDARAASLAWWEWMLEPLFHDWHIVRLGWATHLTGSDPLADLRNPYNYPRFVLMGGVFGGLHVSPAVAGLGIAALFLAAASWMLRPASRWQALGASALLLAPPVLLLLERANLDAIVFVLVLAGIVALTRRDAGRVEAIAGSVALVIATWVKLYPAIVFVVAFALCRGERRRLVLGAAVLAAAGLALAFADVALVLQKTTRGYTASYGRMIAGSRYFVEMVAPEVSPEEGARWLARVMRVSLAVALVGFAGAGWAGWRCRNRIGLVNAGATPAALCCAGALTYAGTFLLGSNWAYRLVFLLLCVPWLWRAVATELFRPWAMAAAVAGAVLFFTPFQVPLGWFLAQQLCSWGLAWLAFAAAIGLIASSAGTDAHEAQGRGV